MANEIKAHHDSENDELENELEENPNEDIVEDPKTDLSDQMQELQDANETLQKANRGLMGTVSAERGKRQHLEGRFDQLTGEINNAIATRKETQVVPESPNIEIDIDDEGNPILSTDAISKVVNEAVQGQIKPIIGQMQEVSQRVYGQDVQTQHNAQMNALLDSREGYREAHNIASKQWQVLSNIYDRHFANTGVAHPTNIEAAIDYALDNKDIMDEFGRAYPNADIESLMEGFMTGSPRKLRRVLDSNIGQQKNEINSLLTDAPQNLSSMRGSGTKAEMTVDRVLNMDQEEFEALPQSVVDKFERMASR